MLHPGTSLGRYTILDLVAVGGMGEVYRAEDARLHRDVAIKVLPAHLERDRVSLDRFYREARAVAALSHPNILAIFDFGSENGIHYAVTELLEGETLRTRINRARPGTREALEILVAVADGVAAAHARGIVHRDLKPENIFITRDGRVKVLDFGLARSASGIFGARGEGGVTEMLPTEPGIVIGTVGYLAPEQLEARPTSTATDVFALGCMLFELLAGHLPFERGSSAHSMVALLHDDAPHLQSSGEPMMRDLDALVQRCLQKDPHDRPREAGEIANELRALLAGERLSRAMRVPLRRTLGRRIAIGVVALLTILAFIGAFVSLRDPQLDHGYDIRTSDIRGDKETKRLIELALRADAEGNRPKAMELLEEAWRRPSATAFPPALLSSFTDAAGNIDRASYWAAEANKRLAGAPVYESLLARYLAMPSVNSQQELALAKSALDLRPGAWRLRLAAAHIYLGQRDREAARRELMQIDVQKPDDRRLMLVLADRASLGDVDGAERDLRKSRLMQRPALLQYTEARIAWSRGDAKRAADLFDRAAQEAANEGLGGIEAEARELAGLALLRRGEWAEAQRRFAASVGRARQLRLTYRTFASYALAAYAAHRIGDTEERDRKLNDAAAIAPPAEPQVALRLLAIRLGSEEWRTWSTENIAPDPQLLSSMALIRAREAFAAGNVEAAKRELRRARAEGIEQTELREEAELLSHELGLPAQRLPADPPYPNVLRYVAIFDLERR
ncbi:MAG TPA: protein kinase [Thermoanaerobaculia bacterium]|nr:protein kinase [Thermoanaerobaculia bacterium]